MGDLATLDLNTLNGIKWPPLRGTAWTWSKSRQSPPRNRLEPCLLHSFIFSPPPLWVLDFVPGLKPFLCLINITLKNRKGPAPVLVLTDLAVWHKLDCISSDATLKLYDVTAITLKVLDQLTSLIDNVLYSESGAQTKSTLFMSNEMEDERQGCHRTQSPCFFWLSTTKGGPWWRRTCDAIYAGLWLLIIGLETLCNEHLATWYLLRKTL